MTDETTVPEDPTSRPRRLRAMKNPAIGFANKRLALQAACHYVQKRGHNEFHGYQYATAAAVLEKVNDAMVELGLISRPTFQILSTQEIPRLNKNPERIVTVACELWLYDVETAHGEIVASAMGAGQDVGDKAVMKAQTAAIKYAWMTALNISTGDDPEDDKKADQRNEEPLPAEKPAPPKPRPAGPPRNRTQEQTAGLKKWKAELDGVGTFRDLALVARGQIIEADRLFMRPEFLAAKQTAISHLLAIKGTAPLIEMPKVPLEWHAEFLALDEAARVGGGREAMADVFKLHAPSLESVQLAREWLGYAKALSAELGFVKPGSGKAQEIKGQMGLVPS